MKKNNQESKKYAHKCDKCGCGMNDGYFVDYEYYCSDTCLHTIYTPEEWTNMYEESEEEADGNYCYWTQWEDEEDYQYQIIVGKLEEIN
jgi:hypothetical protein